MQNMPSPHPDRDAIETNVAQFTADQRQLP